MLGQEPFIVSNFIKILEQNPLIALGFIKMLG
jgi:hypothetical protein